MLKRFCLILLLGCFFTFIRSGVVFAEAPKFLTLPFFTENSLLQGWFYNNGSIHKGIDYRCKTGDPLYADADGLAMHSIQKINSSYSYGNFVFIYHQNGYASLYGHLSKVSEDIKSYSENQRNNTNYSEWTPVKKGQYIGDCGNTGTQVPHLHFEVTKGKYSVDKIDSYDLYKVSSFYPPNKDYTELGTDHLWEFEPPKYLVKIYDPNQKPPKPKPQTSPQTQPQPQPKTSLWSKILNFFSSVWASEESAVKTEAGQSIGADKANNPPNPPLARGEENNPTLPSPTRGGEEVYNLQFLNSNQNITAQPGEVINLKAEVKNTGTAVWKKSNISANVVGGSTINLQYYHSSWLTYLRPVLLNENEVAPGNIGNFSFIINTPEQAGDYQFRIQAVRTEAGFAQIAGGFWTMNLRLAEPEILKESVVQKQEQSARIEEKAKVLTEKIVDKVEETAPEVFQTIKTFFGGGGGGSSSSGQVQEEEAAPEEEPEEQPEEKVEEELEEEVEEELPEEENEEENLEEEVEIILPEIQITSPTTSPWYTQATSTIISGTYNTSTFQIFVNNTSTPDLIMASSTWQYPVSLPISTSTFSFVGWNADLTVSSTELNLAIIREEEQIPDFTPPVITDFTITINNTTALVSHEAVDENSGVTEYTIQFLFPFNIDPRSDCSPLETEILPADDPLLSDWEALVSRWFSFPIQLTNQCLWFSATSTATTTVFEFPEDFFDLPLFFRLQAADQAGNITDWLYSARKYYLEGEDDGLPQEGKVLVSEIAWMGTGASPQDEWLEIINFDDQKIYLKDWRLVWGENIIYLDRVILSPYYSLLLERNSQNTVSDYDRSQVYYAGELDDAGEHLILYSGLGNIMDEVDASAGWFAGNNETKESMFRVDPPLNGNLPEAWVDFFASNTVFYGWYTIKHDADGNPIAGSPGDDEPVGML